MANVGIEPTSVGDPPTFSLTNIDGDELAAIELGLLKVQEGLSIDRDSVMHPGVKADIERLRAKIERLRSMIARELRDRRTTSYGNNRP